MCLRPGNVSSFKLFVAVSLCVVAGLAETFPSFTVRGPFLPDVPGFQVPPGSRPIYPPQLWSSSRARPLSSFKQLLGCFQFISSFDVPEPFQHSHSHNHRYRFHLYDSSKISSFLRCSNMLIPLPIAPFSYNVVVMRF